MSEQNPQFKWRRPEEAMTLHLLKKKKKALQARISTPAKLLLENSGSNLSTTSISANAKRKNPFLSNDPNKKTKLAETNEESQDSTLFSLYKFTNSNSSSSRSDVDKENLPNKLVQENNVVCEVEIVKATGAKTIPVDWALKTKVRFMSLVPFIWNQTLKTSEEASGTTGFARCLDIRSTAPFLDTSSNAKFHQCCLFWQHPYFPWIDLFPRTTIRASGSSAINLNVAQVKKTLHSAWSDSFRNLFQLLRTRQCAYFYLCANSYTVLFRAGGVAGFTEMNALITPTTRGFRHILRQEEIEFTMPLKAKPVSGQFGNDLSEKNDDLDDDEPPQEHWLKSMGIKEEDIRQINYTEEKIQQKLESEVDNSEQSLVHIEGVEVQALYNFLINCKSIISATGPVAGIPPTLLAPVAFQGGMLNGLKVRQSKVHNENENYYSLELSGPILPHVVHNLFAINPPEHSITATFANLNATMPFSKFQNVNTKSDENIDQNDSKFGSAVFGKAGLSDCGLSETIIDRFCSNDDKSIANVECIKYSAEDRTYSWT